MTVFKETYEVTGAPTLKLAREFAAKRTAALDAQWALVKALGASGFRPGYRGVIKSLLFDVGSEIPTGLRNIRQDGKKLEYEPSRNTKSGKAIEARISASPRVEGWGEFANTFGWKGRSPMDSVGGRGVIYFAAGIHILKPRERFFLTYPRELKDGWNPPAGLKLVRESDMLRAIEDHNAAVKIKAA